MDFFTFIQFLIEKSVSNSKDPDQTPHSATSDLGLHCLPLYHKKTLKRLTYPKGGGGGASDLHFCQFPSTSIHLECGQCQNRVLSHIVNHHLMSFMRESRDFCQGGPGPKARKQPGCFFFFFFFFFFLSSP